MEILFRLLKRCMNFRLLRYPWAVTLIAISLTTISTSCAADTNPVVLEKKSADPLPFRMHYDNEGVAARNLPLMHTFYTKVMGADARPFSNGNTQLFFQLGGVDFYVFHTDSTTPHDLRSVTNYASDAPGYDHLVFDTPDLNIARARLATNGVKVEFDQVVQLGGQWYHYLRFNDPEGNLLGIRQHISGPNAAVKSSVPVNTSVLALHFANEGVAVRDVHNMYNFYTQVLGAQASPPTTDDFPMTAVQLDGMRLFVFQTKGHAPHDLRDVQHYLSDPAGYDHLVFQTDSDISIVRSWLQKHQIHIDQDQVFQFPEEHRAFHYLRFKDPEGNLLGIRQEVPYQG